VCGSSHVQQYISKEPTLLAHEPDVLLDSLEVLNRALGLAPAECVKLAAKHPLLIGITEPRLAQRLQVGAGAGRQAAWWSVLALSPPPAALITALRLRSDCRALLQQPDAIPGAPCAHFRPIPPSPPVTRLKRTPHTLTHTPTPPLHLQDLQEVFQSGRSDVANLALANPSLLVAPLPLLRTKTRDLQLLLLEPLPVVVELLQREPLLSSRSVRWLAQSIAQLAEDARVGGCCWGC
jgi:hypothetical protein